MCVGDIDVVWRHSPQRSILLDYKTLQEGGDEWGPQCTEESIDSYHTCIANVFPFPPHISILRGLLRGMMNSRLNHVTPNRIHDLCDLTRSQVVLCDSTQTCDVNFSQPSVVLPATCKKIYTNLFYVDGPTGSTKAVFPYRGGFSTGDGFEFGSVDQQVRNRGMKTHPRSTGSYPVRTRVRTCYLPFSAACGLVSPTLTTQPQSR